MREKTGHLQKRVSRRGRIYCPVDVASERARVWETFECHGDFVCMSLLTIFRLSPNKMMVSNKPSYGREKWWEKFLSRFVRVQIEFICF